MQSLEFLEAWRTRSSRWQDQVPAPPAIVAREWLEDALQQGEPLVLAVQPQVPAGLFAEVLLDLMRVLQQYRTDAALAPLARAVREATAEQRQALAEAALAASADDLRAWAAEGSATQDLLLALAPLALQPFLGRYAHGLTQAVPLQSWRQTYCPVCGREPDVARIDPDNLRHLHCGQCGARWQYHRLPCIWCGTEDPKQVQILQATEWEPWRVDVCDACGGYVKTLDQRHGGTLSRPGVDLFLEDARTRQLDVVAQQRGYRRGGRAQ